MGSQFGIALVGLLAALGASGAPAQTAAQTSGDHAVLAEIERRGVVRCGVSFTPGFAANDDSGRPVGFMVDLCRALAAAVLGKADAIEIRRLSKPQEFAAVAAGEVDVSFAQTSWTLTRDAAYAVDFGPPVFHDTQAIAAWPRADGRPALEAGGLAICVPAGSTSQTALEADIGRAGRPWILRPYPGWPDALEAFLARECGALSTDRASLATALRALDASQPDRHGPGRHGPETPAGPEIMDVPFASREPITPLTPSGDRLWMAAVRWTIFALVLAEDAGVTGANANFLRITGDSEVRRLLSGLPDAAARAGLRPDWAYQAIVQVGNYGEIFERNLGTGSPFKLDRGLNKPWTRGGLLYAPVFQ